MDTPAPDESPRIVLSYPEAALVARQHADALRQTTAYRREARSLLSSLGGVLAQPVLADRDQPPFRRATRDGFACRAADLGGPVRVTGQIRAGEPAHNLRVGPGEAIEIMTGAAVPDGADCVVMVEYVVYDASHTTVRLFPGRTQRSGDNLVPAGAEARQGDLVLPVGQRLAPQHVAAAAACGYAKLDVFPRPRVAVLATGDELVEIDQQPLPYQIRNSNSYSLAAQVAEAGGEAVRHTIVPDRVEAIEAAIRAALDADLLILSGGVSMGRYDFVEHVLLSLGAEFFFTGVLIQPGRPVVFGRLPHAGGYRYFFGLPGNPVSTLVTFLLFVEPLLAALAGRTTAGPRFVQARIEKEVRVKTGLTRFLPAVLNTDLLPQVEAVAWQGSGDLVSTAMANCYLVIPPDRDLISAGESVSVLLP